VGHAFAFGAGPTANVLDIRDPTNTENFLTSFNLAADPFDITIGAGIAFVADGAGGLQVVNYLPFDNQGQAPTITLSAPGADLDPATQGIQAIEGSLIDLILDVGDDQQVRNVELLVDGQVVTNDVAFPWTTAVALPVRTGAKTTAVIQARATDTGGNTTLSDELVIDLVPDTFAPTIEESNVADGSRHGQSFRTVRLRFSETLDPGGISADHFRLLDTSNAAIVPSDVALDSRGEIVTLTMPVLAQGSYRLVIDGNQVTDRASNAFGSAGQIISTFEIAEATITWTAPGGGDWNNPANWDQGRVPDATDDVLLSPAFGGAISLSGNASVGSIELRGETFLSISSGTLHVNERIVLANESEITLGGDGAIAGTSADNPMTVEGGTLVIAASSPAPASLAWLRLSGTSVLMDDASLELRGTVWMTHSANVFGRGSLVVTGHLIGGYVDLDGYGDYPARLGLFGTIENSAIFLGHQSDSQSEIGGSGTLGPDIMVSLTGNSVVGSEFFAGGNGSITNQGEIYIIDGNCTINIPLINEGQIRVSVGSTIDDPSALISGNLPSFEFDDGPDGPPDEQPDDPPFSEEPW